MEAKFKKFDKVRVLEDMPQGAGLQIGQIQEIASVGYNHLRDEPSYITVDGWLIDESSIESATYPEEEINEMAVEYDEADEDTDRGCPFDEKIEYDNLPEPESLIKTDATHIMSWGVNESYGEMRLNQRQKDIIEFVADCRKEEGFKNLYKINDTVFKIKKIVSL